MKECIVCHELKPVTEYYTTVRRGKLYTQARCKPCHQLLNKSWYERNKDKKNAISRAWQKANPDRHREAVSKSSGAYYHKITSPLIDRACQLFEKMNDSQRTRFSLWILKSANYSRAWQKVCRSFAIDEWLGAYSGI